MAHARFSPGMLYITPGALLACKSFPMPPDVLFIRHLVGDWSDMHEDDQRANERAILDCSRIFSAYRMGEQHFFVITEADRSATTILLASEY